MTTKNYFYAAVLILLAVPAIGYAQEDVRSKKGLKFTVPEDWPIETRNGVVAPIPIEEYVSKKFRVIDEQLDVLNKTFSSKIQEWEALAKDQKENWSGDIKKINAVLEELAGDLRGLVYEVGALNRVPPKIETKDNELSDQLDRLDRRLDTLERRMTSLEFHLGTLEDKQNAR